MSNRSHHYLVLFMGNQSVAGKRPLLPCLALPHTLQVIVWPSQDTFDLLGPHNLVVSVMELLADNIPFLPSELREQLLAVTDMARHKRDVLQVSGLLIEKGQEPRKAEPRKADIPHLHYSRVVGAVVLIGLAVHRRGVVQVKSPVFMFVLEGTGGVRNRKGVCFR